MGIQGLLPLLKSIHRPTELKKFSGETFGIDAYGWLHRGAISCAIELAQGKPTRKYVDFAMNRVRMLKHFGVTPYLVFDGDFLPSKAATEASRSKRREEGRKLGLELLKAGKPSQAHQELQKAIDVTPEMARHLIEALKRADVPYVVAPYEADAQLVYLERQGITSGIISEDSDLLVFGAKRLITKLDQYGQCVEINRRDFNACREVSFVGWDDKLFRQMAILSGCDYLESIPSLGLKTAHRLLRKHKQVERIIRTLQFEGKHRIPADYLKLFHQAEQTFLYQWAFCPTSKQLVNLSTLPSDLSPDQLPFIGSFVEPQLAQQIATGDVNPITKQEIVLCTIPSPRKRTASTANRSNGVQTQSPRDTPKKPINAYFKDHRRIPLAEMDANCFHVKSENVTREGIQPIVFPLPRPYIDSTQSTASGPSRTYINTDGSSSRALRRRIEPVSNLLTNGGRSLTSSSRRKTTGPEEKSKFFSPNSWKARTTAKGEGYLMSDDSVEEALRELPDVEGWPKRSDRRKTIAVFESDCSQPGGSGAPKDDEKAGPSSASDLAYEQSGTIIPDTPPKSAFDRFTYINNAPTRTSQSTRLSRRQSSISSTRSSLISLTPISAPSSQPTTARTTPATTPRLTPLQQLERKALGQDRESPTSKFAVPRAPKRSSLGRLSLDLIPINPAFVPLPSVDIAELEMLNGPIGSEDLLVPESETEELEAAVELESINPTGRQTSRRTMDLSRFMFALS
ncbi:PIN domain-like protein [Hypoxylon argillaceum]|nr:PIN domain-like protein [Hypoxylon argillaceum]